MSDAAPPKIEITEQVGVNFFKTAMVANKFASEFALTINMPSLCGYYVSRVGIPPVVNMWEEIRALVLWCINNVKLKNVEKLPFVIRFVGGGVPVWLILKLYALVVYECDSVYAVGDIVVKI